MLRMEQYELFCLQPHLVMAGAPGHTLVWGQTFYKVKNSNEHACRCQNVGCKKEPFQQYKHKHMAWLFRVKKIQNGCLSQDPMCTLCFTITSKERKLKGNRWAQRRDGRTDSRGGADEGGDGGGDGGAESPAAAAHERGTDRWAEWEQSNLSSTEVISYWSHVERRVCVCERETVCYMYNLGLILPALNGNSGLSLF